MFKRIVCILLICSVSSVLIAAETAVRGSVEDVIEDIYRQLLEVGEVDYEELQEELMEFVVEPIDLNNTSESDLLRLRFLTPQQVDAILLYAYKHPFETLDELDLLPELQPYEVRNLKAFVTVKSKESDNRMYLQEVFHNAKHELIARVDVRNIERFENDPVYGQFKYKFNYQNRVQFGAGVSRNAGAPAKDMSYGAYIQLNDLAPHLHTIVAGNYQAFFGQGMVLNSGFHMGKSSYVLTAGNAPEGLKKYSSASRAALHGVGTTLEFGDITRLKTEISVLYGMTRSNDSAWKHTVGANLTFKHRRLKFGLTAVENVYSDSLQYYFEHAAYNQNYFRGDRQAVLGMNFRYNHGWFDLFGEVAAAQNQKWGVGTEVGCRFLPVSDVGLVVLYRYYSPTFDNTLGYGFSETSRINDEHGVYLGAEIKRLKDWRFEVYGDVFRFSAQKYGIKYAPSWGYDVMAQADWVPKHDWSMSWRLRAREKGRKGLYSFRYQFNWQSGGWKLRTEANANLKNDTTHTLTYGISAHQDIQYAFAKIPIVLQLRLQGFDVRNWDNRIYTYENDVLYAFSIPATYGTGGRFYLNFRWRILPQLALYLRISETIYAKSWASQRDISQYRTDIHLLIRATF